MPRSLSQKPRDGLVPIPFNQVLEYSCARRMSKLAKSLDFDLTDPLARDVEVLANFFQSPFTTVRVHPEPQTDDLLLAGAEGLQDVTRNVAHVGSDHQLSRTDSRLILDKVSDL